MFLRCELSWLRNHSEAAGLQVITGGFFPAKSDILDVKRVNFIFHFNL